MSVRSTRRDFMKKTALAAAALGAPTIIPARALGLDGNLPPSQRLVIGHIGVGGMGGAHMGHFLGERRVRIAAVCDVYGRHREEARARVGDECDAYVDYRELLDRKDIDAVVVATPDHWHTLVSLHALEAGKDVYCEKPLTLTINEGKRLVEATRRYGRVFQVGSQQRSDRLFRHACELVRNGRIGKLLTVRSGIGGGPTSNWQPDEDPPADLDWDMWLGPAPWVPYNPQRCIYNFRWFFDYSGGKMTDWGAHHNDIAQWGIGADGSGPVEVEGWGVQPMKGLYDTLTSFEIKYTYANGVVVNCNSNDPNGARFEGTDGWVFVTRGSIDASDKDLLEEKFGAGDIRLYASDEHHNNWLNCIETRERPITDVEIGHRSVSVCHMGNIAVRMKRKLQWDPVKEEFVNDEEANRWLEKPYRAPWHL